MSDFRAARDFLLHADYDTARSDFRWPEPAEFNWALDWFDGVLAAETPDAIALKIPGKVAYTFAELSVRSNRVANWLHEQGVRRGDRVLLMLGNQAELWESLLAAMKLGAVPDEAPTGSPMTSRMCRAAATLAASGTGTTRFTRSGRKPGSTRGRPMPSIREGIPVP